MQNIVGDDSAFDQMIYVTYPEYHYVMQMYVCHDVTKRRPARLQRALF